MELRQLLYFKELAEQRNLRKAAATLYITPQALSKSIQKLAKEFEKDLFFRDRGQLTLTVFGHEFYKETILMLNHLLPMEDRLHKIAKQENKIITIGSSHGLMYGSISHFITHFQKSYPEIQLDITELPDVIVENSLHHDDFDVAFTIGPPSFHNEIKYQFLEHYQICAVVNQNHPLAKKKKISLNECKKYPIYTKNRFFKIHDILENFSFSKKIDLNYQLQSPSEILWTQLVSTTDGIGIGTTFYDTFNVETTFSHIPFIEKELSWDIYIAYKKEHYLSESTVIFLNEIIKFFSESKS